MLRGRVAQDGDGCTGVVRRREIVRGQLGIFRVPSWSDTFIHACNQMEDGAIHEVVVGVFAVCQGSRGQIRLFFINIIGVAIAVVFRTHHEIFESVEKCKPVLMFCGVIVGVDANLIISAYNEFASIAVGSIGHGSVVMVSKTAVGNH